MSPRKPIQKATVIKTACEHQTQTMSRADRGVLHKIQKCLNRAYYANASEAEAKTALFISQKLMSEHNVTQADLRPTMIEAIKRAMAGGASFASKKSRVYRGGL
jgi:hypothetical protein